MFWRVLLFWHSLNSSGGNCAGGVTGNAPTSQPSGFLRPKLADKQEEMFGARQGAEDFSLLGRCADQNKLNCPTHFREPFPVEESKEASLTRTAFGAVQKTVRRHPNSRARLRGGLLK